MTNFLTARWENLVMFNYEVEPSILKPFLPPGTELDYHNGKTFVSLVGFLFRKTRLFRLPVPVMGKFEEVNLRFYVVRKEGGIEKRGVVFISEVVPYRIVAALANSLYREHYSAMKMRHEWTIAKDQLSVSYSWLPGDQWQSMSVSAANHGEPLDAGSHAEFILEHYFGYTKLDDNTTEEYGVAHPRWMTFPVSSYQLTCDFQTMYGEPFKFLNQATPYSVLLAEGSEISVGWKRRRITATHQS